MNLSVCAVKLFEQFRIGHSGIEKREDIIIIVIIIIVVIIIILCAELLLHKLHTIMTSETP